MKRWRTRHDVGLALVTVGYAIAATILASAVTGVDGVLAGGIGSVAGVAAARWLDQRSFRAVAVFFIGVAVGWIGGGVVEMIGRASWVPSLIGLMPTLVLLTTITTATATAGIVMMVRSVGQRGGALAMIEGTAIAAAVGVRFAAHRHFQWGSPRFLADWAGMEGLELPTVFAVLGLSALLVGLASSLRKTSVREATTSMLTVTLLMAILLWLGGPFLRNPTVTLLDNPASGPASGQLPANENELQGSGDAEMEATESTDSTDRSDGGQTGEGDAEASGSTPNEPQAGGSQADDSQAGDAQAAGSQAAGSQSEDSAAGTSSAGDSSAGGAANSGSDAASGAAGAEASESASNGGGASQSADDPLPSSSDFRRAPQPVAVVLLENDIEPYEKTWYFRQTAVSQFNGRRLVATTDARFDDDMVSEFPTEPIGIGGIPLPEDMHELISATVSLIEEQPRPFGLPSVIELEPSNNPDPQYFRHSFRFTSCVLTDPFVDDVLYDLYADLSYREPGDEEWDEEMWTHYTQPPGDPRYLELAEKIVADRMAEHVNDEVRESAMLKGLAIKRYLEANTTYSFSQQYDEPEVNPADEFLFGHRHGYCTHTAHASVYLMRSLGIPARIGVGFAVPQSRSGKSSAILIQDTDAHAWPELYLEGAGWFVLDVAPEKIDETTELPPEPDPALSKFLADKARQKSDHAAQLQRASGRGLSLATLIAMLKWLAIAAIASLYLAKLWIVHAPRWADRTELIRLTQRAVVLRLAEAGLRRDYGETRAEFASRVLTKFPEFATLTELHLRDAYGRRLEVTPSHCLELQRRTNQRLRQSVGHLRRWWGTLDPRFWVLTR